MHGRLIRIDFRNPPDRTRGESTHVNGRAPRQGDEGAPNANLILASEVHAGLDGVAVGDEIIVLTWLHEADRPSLDRPSARGPESDPEQGVFSTQPSETQPDRPAPGPVLSLDGTRAGQRPVRR
jgi:tRNA (Thr-GGU) A37 N-methylase